MSASPRPPDRRVRRGAVAAGLGGLALLLSGCTFNFENNKGATTQGHTIFRMFQGFDITALAVGIFVWALIFWCVLRYKRRHPDEMPKQTRYNLPWETAYTLIPVLIVAVLFGFTVVGENSVDKVIPNPTNRMTITAFQWGWKFAYGTSATTGVDTAPGTAEVVSDPDHFNTFELPVNETTQVNLVTTDVIHEFFVPAFDFERYAQSGITNVFDLTPTRTGTFIGRCAQFCGLHHDLMIFYVKVVQPAQFQSWLQQQERLGST